MVAVMVLGVVLVCVSRGAAVRVGQVLRATCTRPHLHFPFQAVHEVFGPAGKAPLSTLQRDQLH